MICHHQKRTQVGRVMSQHVHEPSDVAGQRSRGQTKVNHSSVRLCSDKHQFTEITVIGNQDALFCVRDGQHVDVRKAM
jgi:pectin methylesterase-like acyl-CoA thioesterase